MVNKKLLVVAGVRAEFCHQNPKHKFSEINPQSNILQKNSATAGLSVIIGTTNL